MLDLPFQLDGGSFLLVLLPSVMLNSQLRGSQQLFFAQYSFRQEFKQNNHNFSVKMRLSDSLKAYIGNFQNQLAKVHNCSEDAPTLAFINGLRVTHPLYKHW